MSSRAGFEREDDLSDFDLVSLIHQHIFHGAGERRGNLDHSLVGLQFHHGLLRRRLSSPEKSSGGPNRPDECFRLVRAV